MRIFSGSAHNLKSLEDWLLKNAAFWHHAFVNLTPASEEDTKRRAYAEGCVDTFEEVLKKMAELKGKPW